MKYTDLLAQLQKEIKKDSKEKKDRGIVSFAAFGKELGKTKSDVLQAAPPGSISTG